MGSLQIVKKPRVVLYKDLNRGDFFMILEDLVKKSAGDADKVVFVKTGDGGDKPVLGINPVTLDFHTVWMPPTREVVKVKVTNMVMVVEQV